MEKCGKIVINSLQLLKNFRGIKRVVGINTKICAMVKANAYGHGVEEIVNDLYGKIDYFGVSNINEALFIRKIKHNAKILIAGKTYAFKECIENDISFTIDDLAHFDSLLDYLENVYNNNICNENLEKKKGINIHIKIDTGMNRLGVKTLEDFEKIYKLSEENNINVEGVSTHFATGDCDGEFFKMQQECFQRFIDAIPKRQMPIIHVGGSAALIQQKKYKEKFAYDMIRVGLSLYGYGAKMFSKEIKPVLSLQSKIIKIFNVKDKEFVGYSKGFKAKKDMKIAIIPLGYGDGIPRNLSSNFSVKINGQKCQSIGKICMDMFFVDVSNIECKIDDKIVVMDNAQEWAKKLSTISYEVLTNLTLVR